ncbi:hypothetical protein EUX98_g8829 [Antrodiella citrinella]|uniref:TRIP4/RQT4 C2HC5-type zinc finger domain-containing protein n=1 Tax=Antrodiella citrinella TaxID=2447956 RepID=A0A4S4M427_9APHY|nr:hypothetical protein EUX98_g8829 [Antrodiella citrinella]
MYTPAWHQKTSSSLPSDRIPPAYKQPGGNALKGNGKQKEVPKSRAVQELEELKGGLTYADGQAKDPDGGCFCLDLRIAARVHALSSYTPICRQCGLILCSLNRPQFACPHCVAQLMTSAAREALVASLDTQIEETLAKEERERQQAVEDARQAAGAFPSLRGAAAAPLTGPLDAHPVNQTHKVLSLNSKTRKITVESRRTLPPSAPVSAPTSDAENQIAEKVPPRISHPPADVVVPHPLTNSDRLWARVG